MSLIRLTKSSHGKDAIIDNNYHKYTFNSTGENVNYWTCANRSCKARISTRKSTGNLVGQSIPLHDHSNQLLIKKAKELRTWPIINVLSYLLNSFAFCLTKNICSRWLINFKNRIINQTVKKWTCTLNINTKIADIWCFIFYLYFYIYTKNYPKCYLYEMLPIPNVIYTKCYLDEM